MPIFEVIVDESRTQTLRVEAVSVDDAIQLAKEAPEDYCKEGSWEYVDGSYIVIGEATQELPVNQQGGHKG